MQVSAEFRYWWEGDCLAPVAGWFDGRGVVERRTDRYVRLPGERCLSVKHRGEAADGTVEIKALVERRKALLPVPADCEIWVKHRTRMPLTADGALLPVAKERRLVVFGRLWDGTVAERAAEGARAQRCGAELVRVACKCGAWTSFAMEATGAIDGAIALLADIARAIGIGPDWVDGGIAASYPEWLDRMVLRPAS